MGSTIGSLELWPDSEPAWWVASLLPSIALDVSAVIPDGFDAYARVFHPAARDVDGDRHPVRWAEVAAANHRIAHPQMQWPHISGAWEHSGVSVPGLWDEEPAVGSLPREVATTLTELLTPHTATPDACWFAVWDGWGGLRLSPDDGSAATLTRGRFRLTRSRGWARLRRSLATFRRVVGRRRRPPAPEPTLRLPNREYHLLRGPVTGATETMVEPPGWQSVNLWWPDDRSWFVATEIDFSTTYVGGSAACIEDLLASPDLEVSAVELDHGIAHDSDDLNPPPAIPYI